MNPILKNILAVIAGIIIGSLVNMGLIMIGVSLIALPEGMDPMSTESLKEFMPQLEPKHFIFPFLAHALGTLVGAFVAARIAASRQMVFALIIGAFFLMGGIMSITDHPGPMWFNVLDLVVAYIPVAWLGGMWGKQKQEK